MKASKVIIILNYSKLSRFGKPFGVGLAPPWIVDFLFWYFYRFLSFFFFFLSFLCFSGTNQKPERRRPFGTGLVRHCPQGLFSPFFTFLCATFSRPFRLSLVPTICPWVSEDALRLEECDFGHALGARTFYTSPLRKCQKTYRKTFWLLIF